MQIDKAGTGEDCQIAVETSSPRIDRPLSRGKASAVGSFGVGDREPGSPVVYNEASRVRWARGYSDWISSRSISSEAVS